jgi:hypothetical protein
MTNRETTRRRFLVAAITFSTVAVGTANSLWLKSAAAWAQSTDPDDETSDKTSDKTSDSLTRMAQLLFPHDGLADDVYASVMSGVLAATANDPTMTEILHTAEASLDARSGQSWIELDEAAQVDVMQASQDEAYFAAILGTVRGHFYYNPAVFEHLHYPGPSKGFGGYIKRGFDDIDWLPESN